MVDKLKQEKVEAKLSCEVLKVSRSGYYAWKCHKESKRDRANRLLLGEIKLIHEQSRETYGSPRMTAQLKQQGEGCGKNRVARLMRQAGIFAVASRGYKVKTTDSAHDLPIAPRVYQTENPQSQPTQPNEVWASDITYIPTAEGWLYLAVFLDIFTRKVVGYALADHMRTELVLKALNRALLDQNPDGKKLISHSDRGSQYAAEACRNRLSCLGMTASMSRTGNCYDNAYAESFFHSLKVELVHRIKFKTRKEASAAIFEYIEVWYNKKRLHSSLGFMSPSDYEKLHLAA